MPIQFVGPGVCVGAATGLSGIGPTHAPTLPQWPAGRPS